MAKYYVSKKSAVRGVIESLLVHRVNADNTFEAGVVQSRHQVVTALAAGDTFFTITSSRTQPTRWDLGAQIKIFPVVVEYLKTVQDNRAADNLDNLPTL